MSITKTYILEGLCCPNCAAAIERELSCVDGVKKAESDFKAGTIVVTFEGEEEKMFKMVNDTAVEIDDMIVVKEA